MGYMVTDLELQTGMDVAASRFAIYEGLFLHYRKDKLGRNRLEVDGFTSDSKRKNSGRHFVSATQTVEKVQLSALPTSQADR